MLRRAVRGLIVAALVACLYVGITRQSRPDTMAGRVHVTYWEMWTGYEADVMREVVAEFNRRQDRIHVEMLTMSQIDRKLLLATAGGMPPDVVGLGNDNLSVFGDRKVLLPLDDYLARAGITRDDYIPAYWDICEYEGHMYALPTTPASLALHWNKALFREAGLDPERPPRTLAELDEFAEKLTTRDEKGRLVQMGFMPTHPGWWNRAWGYYFGGQLWDGLDQITTDCPENVRAYEWVQSYSKKYGATELQFFQSGFGHFASPREAFFAGQVAMELHGVWTANQISKYAPHMEWAAAPFPVAPGDGSLADAAYVECNVLCIPVGAKNPEEAFEFIKFVSSQEIMEVLCLGHKKHTPLARVSRGFIDNHPNPYVQVFIDVAKRSRPFSNPKTTIWSEYQNELLAAFDEIWLQRTTPEEALSRVQVRMQHKLDRHLERMKLREETP